PSLTALQRCYDKYILLTQCSAIIPVPDTILLSEQTIELIHAFPKFAKPRFGAGSSGAMLIRDLKKLKELPLDNSYLIQEWLPGDEYSVDVYIHSSGRPLAAVPRVRMKIDSGVAVAARTQHLPELQALAIKVAQTM